jgi:hypothetical protein
MTRVPDTVTYSTLFVGVEYGDGRRRFAGTGFLICLRLATTLRGRMSTS